MAGKEVLWENFSNASFFKIQKTKKIICKICKRTVKKTRSCMIFDYLTNNFTTKNVHIYFFGLKIEFYVKLAICKIS
jgi:hypothetical protein